METLNLEFVKQQIQAPEMVYVPTVSAEGYPVTRVMFNLHNAVRCPHQAAFLGGLDEPLHIYIGTNAGSAKVADIRRSPQMSLYYHVPGSWHGLLMAGEAEVVTDMEIKRGLWEDEWSVYYEGGVEGEDYTIIRIRPVFAEYYHDLTKEMMRFEEA